MIRVLLYPDVAEKNSGNRKYTIKLYLDQKIVLFEAGVSPVFCSVSMLMSFVFILHLSTEG
jgi:hypothetical protein